jgi:hypothetical protein
MDADTPFGTIAQHLELVGHAGERLRMLVANPLALLYSAIKHSEPFAGYLKEKLSCNISSVDEPWRLVLYSDEVVPGNQLSHENRRKVWVIYFSFLEFGPPSLSREDLWFCIASVRSSFVNTVSGGMGQVFKAVVRMFFGGDVHDMSTGGIALSNPDGSMFRLFANLAMFLQDGGAHKAVWHCKGDAGTKLCMLCRNLYSEASGLVDEDGSDMLTCSLLHENELDFANDEDIRGSVRRLAEKRHTASAEDFKRWSQAIGFRHEPHGMLLDPTLDVVVKPASQFTHDWMHAVFVHGVFNTVSYILMEACIRDGIKVYELLHEYVGTFVWPARVGSATLKDMFSKKRSTASRKAKHFKCTASEGLSVYPVMCLFFLSVVSRAGRCTNEVAAFVKMCGVIDVMVAIPMGVVTANMLRAEVASFLDQCVAAGWRTLMHPKFHWLVHMPFHFERFGFLPTCWVHERKHRMVKRYASDVYNTSTFERTVLSEVTAHHMASLDDSSTFKFQPGLVNSRDASAKLKAFLAEFFALPFLVDGGCRTALQARVSEYGIANKGDVVVIAPDGRLGFDVGMVWAFAEVLDEPMAIVAVWRLESTDARVGTAQCTETSDVHVLPLSDIWAPVVYSRSRASAVRIVVPIQFRSFL